MTLDDTVDELEDVAFRDINYIVKNSNDVTIMDDDIKLDQ